jgi:hypothetical protein
MYNIEIINKLSQLGQVYYTLVLSLDGSAIFRIDQNIELEYDYLLQDDAHIEELKNNAVSIYEEYLPPVEEIIEE